MVGCGVGSQHYMGVCACARCASAVCTGDAACTGGKSGAEHRRVQRTHGLVLYVLHQMIILELCAGGLCGVPAAGHGRRAQNPGHPQLCVLPARCAGGAAAAALLSQHSKLDRMSVRLRLIPMVEERLRRRCQSAEKR